MTLTVLLFWIYLFLLTLIFVLQWLSLHGEILIMLLSQFHLLSNKLKTGCPISSHAYSHANWDGLCDHLRDVPWQDIFKRNASAAASEFFE